MPRNNATSERLDRLEERLTRMEAVLRHPDTLPASFWARLLLLREQATPFVFWLPNGPRPDPGALPASAELPAEPWKHLVRRPHPWRKQFYLRCRNLTARQLAGGIRANNLDEESAAANYGVPVEAVREATAYVEANPKLLEIESQIEQLRSREKIIWSMLETQNVGLAAGKLASLAIDTALSLTRLFFRGS